MNLLFNLPILLAGLGAQEMIIIALVVLVLFGARKIPEFARGLGQGVREFKKASQNVKEEIHKETKEVKKELED
ncbi:MAG: twin-arginine translocase TatA/TatE family subunit [Bacteroidetes bacterium]|nr:twin-arginine translocase TatA/TatE family subunit [Bacteroidota bacterium]